MIGKSKDYWIWAAIGRIRGLHTLELDRRRRSFDRRRMRSAHELLRGRPRLCGPPRGVQYGGVGVVIVCTHAASLLVLYGAGCFQGL